MPCAGRESEAILSPVSSSSIWELRHHLGHQTLHLTTHDLHHIVTGFSMTGPGELGVIAITTLQYGYPAFMTLDLGAIALSMLRVDGWSD